MACISENKIEQYVLSSINFSEKDIFHILVCDRCRDIYESLKALYEDLNIEIENELVFNSAERIVILKPIISKTASDSYNYNLAAQSEMDQQKFNVQHLYNQKEDIIGRVLREKATGVVSLYLLSKNREKIIGKNVKLLDLGLETITDDNGFASFGKQKEFVCKGIKIESPRAVFNLKPLELEQKSADEKHFFKLKNKNHDEIHIEVNPNDLNKTYCIPLAKIKGDKEQKNLRVCVLTNTKRLMSKELKKGVSIFETEKDERILTIHIY